MFTIECQNVTADGHIVGKLFAAEPHAVHFNAGSKTLTFEFREGEEDTNISISQTHIRAWHYKGILQNIYVLIWYIYMLSNSVDVRPLRSLFYNIETQSCAWYILLQTSMHVCIGNCGYVFRFGKRSCLCYISLLIGWLAGAFYRRKSVVHNIRTYVVLSTRLRGTRSWVWDARTKGPLDCNDHSSVHAPCPQGWVQLDIKSNTIKGIIARTSCHCLIWMRFSFTSQHRRCSFCQTVAFPSQFTPSCSIMGLPTGNLSLTFRLAYLSLRRKHHFFSQRYGGHLP